MKNAVAHARVLTKEQVEKGLSIPAQIKAIIDFAKAMDFRIVEEYLERENQLKQQTGQSLGK